MNRDEPSAEELGRRYPITIVPYDPAWPAAFEREARHLAALLAPGAFARIEHFGSTAVPGLAAKPVIDALVEIRSFDDARARVIPVLEAHEYQYIWRADETPPHMMFVKGYGPDGYEPGVQLVHLHMAPGDHPIWERRVFRDILRARTDAARQYEALKYRLAALFPNDREAYTRGKSELIHEIVREGA